MSEVEIQAREIKMVPIGEIKLNPKNRNKHGTDQINQLKKIIQYQGFRRPVSISNRTGLLTCGEGRYLAAVGLGMTELPAIFQNYKDEDQEYADGVADNAIDKQAMLDLAAINMDIASLDGSTFDVDWLGIKNFKLDMSDLNASAEWLGMPDFSQEDKRSFRHIIVHFDNEEDCKKFFNLIDQNDTGETKSIWFPPQDRMDTESKRYG
jgi:hypothetical protein